MSQPNCSVSPASGGMRCSLCLYGHDLEVPAMVTIDGCSLCQAHGDAVLNKYHNIYFWADGPLCFPETVKAIREGIPA